MSAPATPVLGAILAHHRKEPDRSASPSLPRAALLAADEKA